MRASATNSAELEVCDACEGVWIDWSEGEVHAVAAEHEAARLDRSLSWVVQRAWKIARLEIRKLPSVNEVAGEGEDDEG